MRSNWRTLGDTWEKISTWKKKTGRRMFDFLKEKIVLEATTSDDFSTSYLRTNKFKFVFADVVDHSSLPLNPTLLSHLLSKTLLQLAYQGNQVHPLHRYSGSHKKRGDGARGE